MKAATMRVPARRRRHGAGDAMAQRLRESLVAECIAIDNCRELIQDLGSQDPTTSHMLREILALEEHHADKLADLLVGLSK